jgi:hypothetical protein
MKIFQSFLALIFLSPLLLVYGQENKPAPSPKTVVTVGSMFSSYPELEAQAKEIGEVFVRKDYDRFAELTYPEVVRLAGGKEAFLKQVTEEMKGQEDQGLRVLSSVPTEVTQFLNVSGSLYAVIPTVMRLNMRGQLFEGYGCLVAISGDRGKHWTFIGTGSSLKDLLPQVADKLILCPEKRPVKL